MQDNLRAAGSTLLLVTASLTLLFVAVVFVWRPLADPDFWWHLKTGELIFTSGALPKADPFNYTSDPATVGAFERLILKGYWLWQVLAYGLYRMAGFAGIKLLGGLTLVVTYAVISRSLWRSRVPLVVALPLVVVSLCLYERLFFLERPQVITFLASTLLVAWFVAIRNGARPTPWLYPLMLMWANMHGGVIVGSALLGLFALGSCWDCRHDPQRRNRLVLWCIGGVLSSGINPNGFAGYPQTLKFVAGVAADAESLLPLKEYVSPFVRLVDFPVLALSLLLLVACHLLALGCNWRKGAMTDWLVSVSLLFLGAMWMRNLAFVAVALIPLTGDLAGRTVAALRPAIIPWVRWAAVLMVVMLGISSGLTALERQLSIDDLFGRADAQVLPVKLARFLAEVPLEGRLFNKYGWGGYLLWELYPRHSLFIDGRGLNEQARIDYAKIHRVSLMKMDGRREYEVLLDAYSIDIVALPLEIDHTAVNPLLKFLLAKPDWQPVYLDDQAFVLVRNTSGNQKALARYGIDKQLFLTSLLAFYDANIRDFPKDYRRYFGRGELLGYLGRYTEAERDFAMVRKLDPGNPYLEVKLRQLERLKDRGRGIPPGSSRATEGTAGE